MEICISAGFLLNSFNEYSILRGINEFYLSFSHNIISKKAYACNCFIEAFRKYGGL